MESPCPLERNDRAFHSWQKVKREPQTSNPKCKEHCQRFRPQVDINIKKQRGYHMTDNQDRQIGRPIVSTMMKQFLPSSLTALPYAHVTLHHKALPTQLGNIHHPRCKAACKLLSSASGIVQSPFQFAMDMRVAPPKRNSEK